MGSCKAWIQAAPRLKLAGGPKSTWMRLAVPAWPQGETSVSGGMNEPASIRGEADHQQRTTSGAL
eukprot:6032979-Alexandrium_andersonii.AAC.1